MTIKSLHQSQKNKLTAELKRELHTKLKDKPTAELLSLLRSWHWACSEVKRELSTKLWEASSKARRWAHSGAIDSSLRS